MYVLHLVTLILNVLTCSGQTFVVNVVETLNNTDVTLTCNTPSSTNLTRWTYLARSTGTSLMSYQNGQCTESPSDSFLSGSRYSYACNRTVHQVVMHSFAGSWNNHILACRGAVQPDGTESAWLIKVVQDGEQCNCDPTITFSVREITEGDNVTFIRRVSSDVPHVNWNLNFDIKTPMVGGNGFCGIPTISNAYTFACNRTVYQITRLNVQRSDHNGIYMCTPSTQQEGTGSNWIIKINAQVTFVTMTPVDYLVNVKESTPVEFTCTTSTARPAASVYWYRHPNGNRPEITQITVNITTVTDYNDLSITTSILRFVPTRQDIGTKIYCTANNSINASPVNAKGKSVLNVLYKAEDPYIPQGREYRVMENTGVTLSCSVNGGNPKPTLSWSCNNFSPTNQPAIDSDENVTATLTWTPFRTHEGTCTCTSQQKGFQNTTAEMSLIVFYAASITAFIVDSLTRKTVTIDEREPIRLICIADSNPTAVMTLSRESITLINVTSNIVEYKIAEASCSDAATYYCSAGNKYNDYNGVYDTVQLFVNCLPRVREEIKNVNVTSEENKTVTIVFNVIAYPPPTFTWYQLVAGNWVLLEDSDKYFIASANLQCNLTIHSVGINDFTRYKVAVKNYFGQMERTYSLSPYDKPDSPTSLRYCEDRTTTSSILIEWEPGFDNGLSQTFFIKYKKSSDTVWNYLNATDNGEPTMNLTLTGLMENTQYEVIMFASNVKGNSTETNVLFVKTKATQLPPSIPGALIGGITGAVTGCIIIVVVIIIIIRKYTLFEVCSENVARGKSERTSQPAEGNAYYNAGSDTNGNENSAGESAYEIVTSDTEYETINQNKVKSTPYSTLDQTEP